MRKLLFFIAGICMLFACSKSDQFMGDDLNTTNLNAIDQKGLVAFDDEICFEGTSNFYCFASKEGRLVVNPDQMFLLVEAKLTHVEGQDYLLTTSEYMPPVMSKESLYRIIEWEVKISAGGVIMMSWPEKWWELFAGPEGETIVNQVLRHTGCIITGPGVNNGTLDYNGKVDRVNFYAATHFTGRQVQEAEMAPYAGIDGPAEFVFSMTLSKAACLDDK